MSVTIGPSAPTVSFAPSAMRGGGAIPQVRSRSVSLRLGSFGLTYATDQVVWSAATPQSIAEKTGAAEAETGPVGAASPAGDATTAVPPEVAVQQGAQQAAQQPPQPARTFAQDLNDARVQAELQRQARQAAPVSQAETQEAGSQDVAPEPDQGQSGARGGSSFSGGRGGALRRAIGAYLSCAACLSRSAPMLQAVA